jgi:glycerol-3-phosphate acyltransferase PlsY
VNLWISILLVWLLASLPFAYVVARIIRHGRGDDE